MEVNGTAGGKKEGGKQTIPGGKQANRNANLFKSKRSSEATLPASNGVAVVGLSSLTQFFLDKRCGRPSEALAANAPCPPPPLQAQEKVEQSLMQRSKNEMCSALTRGPRAGKLLWFT